MLRNKHRTKLNNNLIDRSFPRTAFEDFLIFTIRCMKPVLKELVAFTERDDFEKWVEFYDFSKEAKIARH